jgi:hypothetical protein
MNVAWTFVRSLISNGVVFFRPFHLPISLSITHKPSIYLTLKPTFSFQFTATLSNSALANKNHPSYPSSPLRIQISLMDSKCRRVKWRLPMIQSERGLQKLPYRTTRSRRRKISIKINKKVLHLYSKRLWVRKLSQYYSQHFLFL